MPTSIANPPNVVTSNAWVAARRLVALGGNPNVGKTTLFNALTGSRARVGNYPGVTVEKRVGELVLETLVVEGDAIALARQLQGRYGGRLTTHTRFGTGKWLIANNQ